MQRASLEEDSLNSGYEADSESEEKVMPESKRKFTLLEKANPPFFMGKSAERVVQKPLSHHSRKPRK